MAFSYWEHKTWFSEVDFTVIGSGLVGLSCALRLRKRYPKSKILVLERGTLPNGASTKNAGFACFGSISEVLSDLKTHSEDEVIELVKQRYEGIQRLRNILGDDSLGYQQHMGHEVFLEKDEALREKCFEKIPYVNQLLEAVFQKPPFELTPNRFAFNGVHPQYITHTLEGQIDTGLMMKALIQKCLKAGIQILNGIEAKHCEDQGQSVTVTCEPFSFQSKKAFIANNGFASTLLPELKVQPARAQVLVTEPIPDLTIQGTFHLDEGYYYFRNIDNRILLGGGRNLDFKAEETTEMETTSTIQEALDQLLTDVILPKQPVEVAQRWSGIMGVGTQKKPIVQAVSQNVFCGVRLGGMGIALGAKVGHELGEMGD
ncbi:MAG: FAD-dependent oxidoreductase [Bacteroidota bacterium]